LWEKKKTVNSDRSRKKRRGQGEPNGKHSSRPITAHQTKEEHEKKTQLVETMSKRKYKGGDGGGGENRKSSPFLAGSWGKKKRWVFKKPPKVKVFGVGEKEGGEQWRSVDGVGFQKLADLGQEGKDKNRGPPKKRKEGEERESEKKERSSVEPNCDCAVRWLDQKNKKRGTKKELSLSQEGGKKNVLGASWETNKKKEKGTRLSPKKHKKKEIKAAHQISCEKKVNECGLEVVGKKKKADWPVDKKSKEPGKVNWAYRRGDRKRLGPFKRTQPQENARFRHL